MVKIETGVDRLVELINQEKRISIDDAAKKLGIGKVVIQEWADFLEEEKIISMEYKFSKTILVERKLSNAEIKVKKKEYASEKDAFVRKVETGLKNLESDALGLEKMKQEFGSLKTDIGQQLDKVKSEVAQLQKYEDLKRNLDKEIEKQMGEFHQILDNAHKEVEFEQKRHHELLEALEIQKREVQVKEHRLLSLEEKEQELMDKIQSIITISKEMQKKVVDEKESIADSVDMVLKLEKSVKSIESNILRKRNSIQPLLDKAKKHEESILKYQEEVLAKARQKTEDIKSKVGEGTSVVQKFQKFFDKKTEVENLILKIDEEKKNLEISFRTLEKKALGFDLATKSNTIGGHMKELEGDLENVNSKRSKLKEDLEKLIKLVKG